MSDPILQIEDPVKEEKPKKNSLKKEILGWVLSFLAAFLAFIIIKTFIFTPVRVQGSSMADTIQDKEFLFATSYDYWIGDPQRGDVVICHYPNRSYQFLKFITLPQSFVKRVVGLPGDTIEIVYDELARKNTVLINHLPLEEEYLSPSRNQNYKPMKAVTLEEDQYFVIGDNRDNSNDSRNLSLVGPIRKKDIVAHVRFVLFPFKQIRAIH